jgi:hypothetical protein
VSGKVIRVTVNQTQTPSSGFMSGLMWQDLGTFTLTVDAKHHRWPSVRLEVGKGGSVDADGVLFVMLNAPAVPGKTGSAGFAAATAAAGGSVTGHPLAVTSSPVGGSLEQVPAATIAPALLAALSNSPNDGARALLANTAQAHGSGVATGTLNGTAMVSDHLSAFRQAVDVAFGGHQPPRRELDGLWAALELDPSAVKPLE